MPGITVTSVPDVVGGKVLSSNGNTSLTYTPAQGIRASVFDVTNPKFPRNITLDNTGLVIYKGSAATVTPVLIPTAAILALAVSVNNNLTWAPTFSTNPASTAFNFGVAGSFTVVVNSELSVTYQWQLSTNNGASWNNLSNTGVYTNVTTATMNISSVTGLGGNQYRCNATNSLGTTTSNVATLTVVDPAITLQPVSFAGTGTFNHTFTITAVGTSTLEYKWYKSVNNGSTWSAMTDTGIYSGTSTASLVLTGATTANNNEQYFCLVGNNSDTSQPTTPQPGQGGLLTPPHRYLCTTAAVLTAT